MVKNVCSDLGGKNAKVGSKSMGILRGRGKMTKTFTQLLRGIMKDARNTYCVLIGGYAHASKVVSHLNQSIV